MLVKTETYRVYEKAGYIPQIYVYLSTNITRRVFSFKAGVGTTGGTGFWDGTREVGDGLTYGSEVGISQTETLLLSVSNIVQSTTQSTRNLLFALSAASVGHVTVTLDNTERYFTDIVSGETPEQFETYPIEIRQGFEGMPIDDQLVLFRGTIIDTTLTTSAFTVSSDSISSSLYDVWECPKSGLYSNPENDNTALPVVLGDCTENSAAGVVVCPQIDTVYKVFALACHPILSEADGNTITLYDSDGVISASEYSVTTSGDYESIGIDIAYVTFNTAPNGTVTGKYKGAIDDNDDLITNPCACVQKLLAIMGDYTDFEDTAFSTASQEATEQGYTCAGVIIADNSKAYWISDILASFLGSWFISSDETIVLQFDSSSADLLATAGDLKQSQSSGVTLKKTRDNIITRPLINYAVSSAQIDKRYKSDALTNYYMTYREEEETGDVTREINFNWMRNTAAVETLAARIKELYAAPIPVYSWKEQGLENVHVEPGDFISFGWDYQRDTDNNYLTGQVGRVLNVTKDFKNQSMTYDFYDTGLYLLEMPYKWDGTRDVGDGLSYGGDRKLV